MPLDNLVWLFIILKLSLAQEVIVGISPFRINVLEGTSVSLCAAVKGTTVSSYNVQVSVIHHERGIVQSKS